MSTPPQGPYDPSGEPTGPAGPPAGPPKGPAGQDPVVGPPGGVPQTSPLPPAPGPHGQPDQGPYPPAGGQGQFQGGQGQFQGGQFQGAPQQYGGPPAAPPPGAPPARPKRTGLVVVATVSVLALLLAVGGGIWLWKSNDKDASTEPAKGTSSAPAAGAAKPVTEYPAGSTEGGISYGQPNAKVTIDVYYDFMCPACAQFHARFDKMLKDQTASGTARVVHHPVAILDRFSQGSKYSTRAASAGYCVAQQSGGDAYAKYSELLFTQQPREGTTGLDNAKLNELATRAGATADISGCITATTDNGFVTNLTQKATDSGLRGTPTIRINGKDVDRTQPLEAQIRAAAGN